VNYNTHSSAHTGLLYSSHQEQLYSDRSPQEHIHKGRYDVSLTLLLHTGNGIIIQTEREEVQKKTQKKIKQPGSERHQKNIKEVASGKKGSAIERPETDGRTHINRHETDIMVED
jgi:hypothetical protein